MERLRILAVTFDTRIDPWELNRFRGAMAHKVGLEHEWFHNHDNETGNFHQRYPLVQYKLDPRNRLQRPMLLCLGQGVEEAHHFFSQPEWALRIGDKNHEMRIAQLQALQHNLVVLERPVYYRLHKWKAFNPENYDVYREQQGIADQFAFLERLLASHLIAFAGGVGWAVTPRFEVKITDLLKKEWVDQKGVKVLAFTIEFMCNLSLPDYIGVGKGAGLGYGVLRRQG